MKKEEVKKEFIDFSRKVERLKILEKELNALDTRGFKSEEKSIRAKLKNVDAIPQIVREISELRKKIFNKSRASVKSKVNSEVLEETKKLRRKLSGLEKDLSKRRKTSGKRQLKKEEVEDVREIPKLERQIKDLKRALEEHTKRSRMKIDTGVGIAVDTNFGEFLNEIKSELTKRLKEREHSMDDSLKMDLQLQKRVFQERYKGVVSDLHDKYRKKVHEQLKKDVKRKLDVELDKKLAEERRKIVKELVEEDAKRLAVERKTMHDRLHKNYDSKENEMVNKVKGKEKELSDKIKVVNEKEKDVKKKMKEYEKKYDEVKGELDVLRKRELAKFNSMRKKVGERSKKLDKFEGELKKKLEKIKSLEEINERMLEQRRKSLLVGIEREKRRSLQEVEELKQKEQEKMHRELDNLKGSLKREFRKKADDLHKKNEVAFKRVVSAREKEIRAEMEQEYKSRLAREMEKKEAALAKRRIQLEKHVVEQAKKLLG